jgi:hydroxyethylthiazole kinase-like uncharacterized protein yjeF
MSIILQNNIIIPLRKENAHKGDHGSVAIIGGAKGMLGAVLLAARAALLSGAGRVYASFLSEDAPKVDLAHPEIMFRDTESMKLLSHLSSVVIGPGLGTSSQASSLLSFWLSQETPLIIDADALNLIAFDETLTNLLIHRKASSIVTPHSGEAARLLQTTSREIECYRIENALKISEKYHAVSVLKGHETIIAHQGRHLTNKTGNAGLASGGSGDVLSGIIGSLVAQGLDAFNAARTGVYIHGAAADSLVAEGIGPIGLTASEVAIKARKLLNSHQQL